MLPLLFEAYCYDPLLGPGSIAGGHPVNLSVRGVGGIGHPSPKPKPPPQTLTVIWEVSGQEMRTVGGGGGQEVKHCPLKMTV